MVSAIKAVEPRQNVARSALPRSVHVAEVVSLALVLASAPASHRLDAIMKIIVLVHINQFPSALVEIECIRVQAILIVTTRIPDLSWRPHLRLIVSTQSLKIIVLVHINQFPSALVEIECIRGQAILILTTRIPEHQSISFQTRSRRVCLITRVSNNHILFTSINVKIVLADVVSPSAMSGLCLLIEINTIRDLGNSIANLLNALDHMFSIFHDLGDVLGVQFLDVLQALLLIDFFSIILFLCASLGPGPLSFCCVLQRHIPHSLVCEDPPSVLWFQRLSEGYDSRERSLWLFASLCVIDVCLRHRHEPHDIAVRMISLCSLTSTLICAVLLWLPRVVSTCCLHALSPRVASTCCAWISIAVAVLSPLRAYAWRSSHFSGLALSLVSNVTFLVVYHLQHHGVVQTRRSMCLHTCATV